VRAHGQVIRYRCSGAGRPVLLLRSEGPTDVFGRGLLATLERSYRLIVPEPPPADADVTAWLAAFLEGLGCSGVRIVAADRFCLPAIELAEADQVARLVLLRNGGGSETTLVDAGVPLLVARSGQPAAELLETVTRFLGAGGAAPVTGPASSPVA
jgi:hypothetical protein